MKSVLVTSRDVTVHLCIQATYIFSYYGYSIISETDRVITFGGYCHLTSPKILDSVTQFKNDEWTLLGLGVLHKSV